MKVGVLALQGAFTEHEDMLSRLGAECFEIRRKQDLTRPMDGLVLPGGESTVMGKLLRELELFQPLKEKNPGRLAGVRYLCRTSAFGGDH